MNVNEKETYNQKDSMIILQFASVGGCVWVISKGDLSSEKLNDYYAVC